MRILIVEDEVKIRRGLAALIAKQTDNEIVGEAKNGREGMELILRANPDLVITDVRMPEMDGLEMIEALQERGVNAHCVILSGYSEFEYAKKAIRYGVDDYLLKPLAPEDILGLLAKIQDKVEQESRQLNDTARRILLNRLSGTVQEGDAEADFAALKVERMRSYYLLSGYGWNTMPAERREWMERVSLAESRKNFPDMHCCLLEETRELVCMMPGEAVESFLKEVKWYMERTGGEWVWALALVRDLNRLHETMRQIRMMYLYGQGSGQVVREAEIADFQAEPFSYPEELEGKIRGALYRENWELFQQLAAEFQVYMGNGKFAPPQVREGYSKLIKRMLGWTEDAGKNTYEKLEPLHFASRIDKVYTREEMNHILDEIVHELKSGMEHREDISNYAIKKAIAYIRLHYAENISLEEIADRLDITPEYLSSLFNREVGINFTVFLRDFRLSHAKRLLKGTNKKVYEIAQEVGYPDSKYFNRVFKENVGISPREFRQA